MKIIKFTAITLVIFLSLFLTIVYTGNLQPMVDMFDGLRLEYKVRQEFDQLNQREMAIKRLLAGWSILECPTDPLCKSGFGDTIYRKAEQEFACQKVKFSVAAQMSSNLNPKLNEIMENPRIDALKYLKSLASAPVAVTVLFKTLDSCHPGHIYSIWMSCKKIESLADLGNCQELPEPDLGY